MPPSSSAPSISTVQPSRGPGSRVAVLMECVLNLWGWWGNVSVSRVIVSRLHSVLEGCIITRPKLCCQRHSSWEEDVKVRVDHCIKLVGEASIKMVGLDQVGRLDWGGCTTPKAIRLCGGGGGGDVCG